MQQALADTSLVKDDVLDTIEEMIARLDEKLSAQMNEIMHAPEFQSIESAWRGLAYISNNSETDATLKLRVMNVSKNELYRDLRNYPDAKWDQSPLFKKIYEAEFGQLGGEPFGCLVGDYHFDQSATDIRLLRDLGKVAAASHCPFISGASPTLLGHGLLDGAFQSARPQQDLRDAGLRRLEVAARLRELALRRAVHAARAGPRALRRQVHSGRGIRLRGRDRRPQGRKYAWMNAAYAMAANINRAYKEYGWTVRIRGVQSGGEVINLPTHTFPTDDGDIDLKCPTEIAISDRREAELSKSGLLPLIHRKNSDKAAFIGAQSLYRPKKYDNPDATASDNISSRIPYMFAVSRFSHYLKCMVRDQIGETKEKEDLQKWLQKWIIQYVDGDPRNSSTATKAKKPLADAKVEVFADEENPGYYSARFFLRPHFQLEGMDIGMSLVSRLPGQQNK